jgi:hypothetical protein
MNRIWLSRLEGCVPYTSPNEDIKKHAEWVLSQMPPNASDNVRSVSSVSSISSDDSDDSDDSGVYLFKRLPTTSSGWRRDLKYVRQKSGGGCGSGKRFVPVSCSKKCRTCHGCSPGCGRNYEFEQIDDFFLNSKTWVRLWNQFENDPFVDYIICRNLQKIKE